MAKYNILLFSNTIGNNYGYSVVAEKLAYYLREFYNVHALGMQSIHPPYKKDGIVFLGINNDPFGSDCLKDYLIAYDIDILITMMDVWVPNCHYIPQTVYDTGVKWICHVTINTSPVAERFHSLLPSAHLLAAPSRFVFDELLKAGYANVSLIPHGVDTILFKPEKRDINDDSFIFLGVMRNKGFQKDFPALFMAYKMFIDRVQDAAIKTRMVILADPEEPEGINLYNLRRVSGLEKNLNFIQWAPTSDKSSIEPMIEGTGFKHCSNINFPREQMKNIYSVADCLVSSSAGESFNLPAIEAMACGLPVIVPDNTTGPELTNYGKCGLLARIQYPLMNPLLSFSMQVSKDSLSECMERLFIDKELRKTLSENGLKHVSSYSWDNVLPVWKRNIDMLIDAPTDFSRKVSGI